MASALESRTTPPVAVESDAGPGARQMEEHAFETPGPASEPDGGAGI
jgi:hypothetical protein